MPPEVYAGDRPSKVQSLQQTLGRFDAVARDPQYALLAQRAEFRATHEWLTHYVAASTATARNTPTPCPAGPAEIDDGLGLQHSPARHRRQAHRFAAGKGLAVLRADRPAPRGSLVAQTVENAGGPLRPAFHELALVTLRSQPASAPNTG